MRHTHFPISRNPVPVSNNERILNYARLKSGVSLTASGDAHYLGLPTRGFILTDPLQVQIVRALNGQRTLQEIALGLLCEPDTVNTFTDLLVEEGVLDLRSAPFDSAEADLSKQFKAHREASEQELLTHRSGVFDGGQNELINRGRTTILISGENRLAHNLLVALQSSGFTQSRLITRAHLPTRIVANDVCGIAVRASDIGKNRQDFTKELIRNSQIAQQEQGVKNNPDLIISTIPIEWDYVQRWMSEGSVHLHINPLIGPHIEIGPLVIPGQTPCIRCVTLIKRENGTVVDREFIRNELPSAAVAFLSGLITLAVAEYVATGSTPLQAASFWYNLLNPMAEPEIRHWTFHPTCGCRQ